MKKIFKDPILVMGLEDEEIEAINGFRQNKHFTKFFADLLEEYFPEFPRHDQDMLNDAVLLFLLIAADRGSLTKFVKAIKKKQGLV